MPFVETPGLRIHHELTGPAGAPAVVLSHSLGTDLSMWEPQARALDARFRVLRYDIRGHGRTTVTPGPCTIELLGGDVVRLLDALGLRRVHFCGLSVGGLIGMWLGAHAPERIEKLVLCNTGARIGTAESWNARICSVRDAGMTSVASAVVERWFSPAFRGRSPDVVARALAWLHHTAPDGYAAVGAAIRDADLRPDLASIAAETLVIAGRQDPATPPEDGRFLASAIGGARYVELEAAHISNLEAESAFTAALFAFLAGEARTA